MSKVSEIKESLDRVKSINVVSQTEGGKIIVKRFKNDILNSLDKLAYNYQQYSHTELISECANLRARLDILQTFTEAKRNQLIAEEDLASAISEESEL